MTNRDLLARRKAAVPRGPFNVAPIFVARALGSRVWDTDGRDYLDFCGGIGTLNVGHNHPAVVDAIRTQSQTLIHSCWHVAMYEPYVELAERLNELAPTRPPNMSVFFNSGAEACENAVKIAKAATKRSAMVAFERGFHGRTLLAMSLTGKVTPYTRGFGPFAPEIYRLPFRPFFSTELDDRQVERETRNACERLFAYHVDSQNLAAIIFEPVLGEGGFLPIREPALRYLRTLCDEHGILLIADEVQTGFARCGSMFAVERYGVVPDLLVTGKSLAGGLPLSAVTGSATIMNAPHVGGIGGTFGGNPVSCNAALAVLDIIEREQLCERAEEIGAQVYDRFSEWSARFPFLAKPRRLGAMCAIDVATDEGVPDPKTALQLVQEARNQGLLLMTASGYVIRTLMPLTIDDADLDEALSRFEMALHQVEKNHVQNA